ncbi:MAG: penicillin-binding protein 2 [Mariprofundales bacterium]
MWDIRSIFWQRLLLFRLCVLLLLCVLLGRMLVLQWLQYDGFMLRAEQNRLQVQPLIPVRGEMYDRHKQPLAINSVSYRVVMVRANAGDNYINDVYALAKRFNWSKSKQKRISKRLQRQRRDRETMLDENLSWETVAPVAARLHNMPGVDIQAHARRTYPYAALAAHVIGYVSEVRDYDLDAGYVSGEHLGRTGLELAWEKELHGSLGTRQDEVDAGGHRIRVIQTKAAKNGKTKRISLDMRLQQDADNALGDRTGAIVVLDVRTGEVLAMVSKPSYDTNAMIGGVSQKQWNRWVQNVHKPLVNRAIQLIYPPASTFKMLTSLAGLRANTPLAHNHTVCIGHIKFADRNLRCWNRYGHGRINMELALIQSCDVYFYELGDAIGMQALREEALLWGFGQKTGSVLQPEARGMAPGRADIMKKRQLWLRGETMISAIGQGAVSANPLQVARFMAAIANGGRLLIPSLIAFQAPKIERLIVVNPEHLEKVRFAMRQVVASPQGTAYKRIGYMAGRMAGKTGTAQVVSMGKKRGGSDKYWHKDHAWFVGFAPAEQPQIAFAVLVEHGEHGASIAAPIAAAVVQAYEKYFKRRINEKDHQ